jgi:hypothetical protein
MERQVSASGILCAQRLTLCFRTEAQAHSLGRLAGALTAIPAERVDLLYCGPPAGRRCARS